MVEMPAKDDDVTRREFKSQCRLEKMMFLRSGGHAYWSVRLTSGRTIKLSPDKVSIHFNPHKLDSERQMPFVMVEWHGRGKRNGPFESIEETHVDIIFRNHKHMEHYVGLKDIHLRGAIRHKGVVYRQTDDGYVSDDGDPLPMYFLLWYVMSQNERQAFAESNEHLVDSLPSGSALDESVVYHTDPDAIRTNTDANGNDVTPAAVESQEFSKVDDSVKVDTAPQIDTAPAQQIEIAAPSVEISAPSVDISTPSIDISTTS
jgi:hypothetical protein